MGYKELMQCTSHSQTKGSHAEIYSDLLRQIMEHVYKPGDKLPTENDLSTRYHVKRFVVRKAINQLIAEGYVFALRNKGYFVRFDDIKIRIRKEISYTQSMLEKKLTPRIKLLEISTVKPSMEQQELFGLNGDERLWEIYVLRYYKNIPFLIGHSYIPYNRTPAFNLYYAKTKSIHKVLREDYGIKPLRQSSICRAGVADKKESRLLAIFENSPLLRVTNVNIDQDNLPIEQCISTFRADMVQIDIEL